MGKVPLEQPVLDQNKETTQTTQTAVLPTSEEKTVKTAFEFERVPVVGVHRASRPHFLGNAASGPLFLRLMILV